MNGVQLITHFLLKMLVLYFLVVNPFNQSALHAFARWVVPVHASLTIVICTSFKLLGSSVDAEVLGICRYQV